MKIPWKFRRNFMEIYLCEVEGLLSRGLFPIKDLRDIYSSFLSLPPSSFSLLQLNLQRSILYSSVQYAENSWKVLEFVKTHRLTGLDRSSVTIKYQYKLKIWIWQAEIYGIYDLKFEWQNLAGKTHFTLQTTQLAFEGGQNIKSLLLLFHSLLLSLDLFFFQNLSFLQIMANTKLVKLSVLWRIK